MKRNRFGFIAAVVGALHLAGLSFAFGTWHWKYLLVLAISGAMLWGVLPKLSPRQKWVGPVIGCALAFAMQQAAFWLWRAEIGSIWWALAQCAAIHFLIGLTFAWLRQRRPVTSVACKTWSNQADKSEPFETEKP